MSEVPRSLEIPLPEGVEPNDEQMELLRATLGAVLALHYERARSFEEVKRKLEAEGWQVRTSLGWCVEARRGREREEALGRTRDEAFDELLRLTRLDDAGGAAS